MSQLAGNNSSTGILVNKNKSDEEFNPEHAFKESHKSNGYVENTDCMIYEDESFLLDVDQELVYPTFSNPFLTDQNVTLGENVYHSHFSEAEHLLEETVACESYIVDEEDVAWKPALEEFNVYANQIYDRDSFVANVRIDFPEETIKQEFSSASTCLHSMNTEITIKTEHEDCEMVDDETGKKVDSGQTNDLTSTEEFLIANCDILTKFSGLPNFSMFYALLDYIKDDLESKKGVTKFEQLFSVLAKLHQNKDNFYLNKYIFPAVYVLVVELLYKKLQVLCSDFPDFSETPELFMPEFDQSQKIVIVGIIQIFVRGKNVGFMKSIKAVKYLIGYTAFGEVFFVSNAFISGIDTIKLINYCGILDKLSEEYWILVNQGDHVCAGQVGKIASKKRGLRNKIFPIISETVQQHTMNVVDRLCQHFKVLEDALPDFMLQSESDICFLDKLVFVCCMLLNMLPRRIYV